MLVDDGLLPVGQDDRPLVLATGAVLGEEARPRLGVHRHDDDLVRRMTMDGDTAPWMDALHRRRDLREHRMPRVDGDAQAVNAAPRSRDVTVAEVEAEQVRVCRPVETFLVVRGAAASLTGGG